MVHLMASPLVFALEHWKGVYSDDWMGSSMAVWWEYKMVCLWDLMMELLRGDMTDCSTALHWEYEWELTMGTWSDETKD